jgi:hypothetical protein
MAPVVGEPVVGSAPVTGTLGEGWPLTVGSGTVGPAAGGPALGVRMSAMTATITPAPLITSPRLCPLNALLHALR